MTSEYDRWLEPPSPPKFWCEGCHKETDHAGTDEGLCVDCNTWRNVERVEQARQELQSMKREGK